MWPSFWILVHDFFQLQQFGAKSKQNRLLFSMKTKEFKCQLTHVPPKYIPPQLHQQCFKQFVKQWERRFPKAYLSPKSPPKRFILKFQAMAFHCDGKIWVFIINFSIIVGNVLAAEFGCTSPMTDDYRNVALQVQRQYRELMAKGKAPNKCGTLPTAKNYYEIVSF